MSTKMATIANLIRDRKRPMSCVQIAAVVGGTSNEVSAVCCSLRDLGWIAQEMRPGTGQAKRQAWYRATPKLAAAPYKPQPKVKNAQASILAAIDAGVIDRAALVGATQIPRSSVSYALENMVRNGTIERIGPGQYARPLDDDGWTPQPYVHPYRAKALGLTR